MTDRTDIPTTTDAMGIARSQTPSPTGPSEPDSVRSYVTRRIGALLARLDTPSARATLARLRGAVAREPGSVPEIWAVTIDGVPGTPRGDEPTHQERAVHTAMTLFAVHQQSRSEPMHVRGVGLGQAIRRLESASPTHGDGEVSPVRRRFDALASATSMTEAAHHLRGIVGQLRSEGIALDYGALAEDLDALQAPGRAEKVRLRWARQYYRTDAAYRAPDQHAGAQKPQTPQTADQEETVR
jgi:CRISPR system Cascade subunit CasB